MREPVTSMVSRAVEPSGAGAAASVGGVAVSCTGIVLAASAGAASGVAVSAAGAAAAAGVADSAIGAGSSCAIRAGAAPSDRIRDSVEMMLDTLLRAVENDGRNEHAIMLTPKKNTKI